MKKGLLKKSLSPVCDPGEEPSEIPQIQFPQFCYLFTTNHYIKTFGISTNWIESVCYISKSWFNKNIYKLY